MNPKRLPKSRNHHHYWIEDDVVYEAYNTIRGLRYTACAEVIFSDRDKLTIKEIEYINKILELNSK